MDNYGPLHPSRIDKGIAASVAATRQKSCNACVRGKRRCDKKAPKCTRCSSKGLECVYARVPPGATADSVLLEEEYFSSNANSNSAGRPGDRSAAASVDSSGLSASDAPDFGAMGSFVDIPSLAGSSAGNTSPESSLDYGLDSCNVNAAAAAGLGTTGGPHTTNAATAEFMQMDDMSGFSIADLLAAGNPSFGGDLWDIHNFPSLDGDSGASSDNMPSAFNSSLNPNALTGKVDPHPLQVVAARPIRDLSMLREECDATFDPLEVHDSRSKPGHILKVFTEIHATFSQTRSLSFLHSRLYATQLPKTVMTAFCAASAYTNRTPETKGWTVKLIGDATREIYAEGERANTPTEKLARLHALLIINSMRMLDGDLWLRAAAEKEMPVMIDWITDIVNTRDKLEEGLSKSQWTDKACPPKSWEAWLLLENIRRAIIASISFFCLISILKGEAPECELWTQPLHFTASRHLWEAQTSVEFYRAWREKPRFLIQNMQYREFWQYATPDDLDEFTRVMLTTQTGTEAMDHFMLGDTSVTA